MSSASSSVTSFLLSLAIFVLTQIQTTSLVEAQPLRYIDCNAGTVAESYPPLGTFSNNLEILFSKLYLKAADKTHTGFVRASAGEGKDRVFGHVLCRGDASPSGCRRCILNATVDIRDRCPYSRSVVVWHTLCSLKYSDKDFYQKLDYKNNFSLVNDNRLTESATFMNTTTSFLQQLANTTTTNHKTLYAAGEDMVCEFLTLYGMAQCTQDLSVRDCYNCLKTAIAELPRVNSQGARQNFWSCNVRYEIYPFFGNATAK